MFEEIPGWQHIGDQGWKDLSVHYVDAMIRRDWNHPSIILWGVHNQLASDKKYAGGLGWCAFDYNTHSNFCSGDRVCYHGVSDIFRIPKPAAGFYKSQCDPKEEIVLEPAFDWARGDRNDRELIGDGIDATRVVMRVTDEYGGSRPFATGAITLSITGPGEIVGDNPFSLFGGVGAVWVRTRQAAGIIRVTATHPTLGSKTIEVSVKRAPAVSI
jgi:hypothetical protein